MISVHQFCEQRDAVAMFLKDGAVGIKLDNKIIKYLFKIREIAKSLGLELINSHFNDDNLYEVPNSNPHNNRNLYQGHYTENHATAAMLPSTRVRSFRKYKM